MTTSQEDKEKHAAKVLFHYVMSARVVFAQAEYEALAWQRLHGELLAGKRLFDGVEVADDLEPPIIRSDAENEGFFLEYVWQGRYQDPEKWLSQNRFSDAALLVRAEKFLKGMERTGPLGDDGQFRKV